MKLWILWWSTVWQLRPDCSRLRNFLWFATVLAGITVRPDLIGVSSIIRGLGLKVSCYDHLLDYFYSNALDVEKLTKLWTTFIIKTHPQVMRFHGKLLLCGDGLKAPKEGKEYIMGHSCQVVSLLAAAKKSCFAIPLVSRIHEGVVFSNRDQRTLPDKMVLMINSLGLEELFYFIADAYYASHSIY